MAQRTGADGFLAPRARLASARVILALAAVAALVLAGCGGDSAGDTASTSGSEAGADSSTSSSAARQAENPAGSKSSGGSNHSSSSSEQSSKASGSSGHANTKHGTQVQLPKGDPEPTATPAEEAQATVADIALASPALQPVGSSVPTLPATYTCDGNDSWPALQWQGVPPHTEELIVFAMSVQPVGGKLFFDWAVAGLDPSLQGLEAGKLPKGAVQGTSSAGETGYSICPPRGGAETYVFALHAIPKALAPAKGFDPHQLREQILAQAANAGILAFAYGRG